MVKTRSSTTKRSRRYYNRLSVKLSSTVTKKTKQKNVGRNVGVKHKETEETEETETEEAILSQPICRDKNQTEALFEQQCHDFKIKYPNYNP